MSLRKEPYGEKNFFHKQCFEIDEPCSNLIGNTLNRIFCKNLALLSTELKVKHESFASLSDFAITALHSTLSDAHSAEYINKGSL